MIFLNQSSKLNVTGINEIFWLILYFSLSHKSLNSYTPYTVLLRPVLRPALALALRSCCFLLARARCVKVVRPAVRRGREKERREKLIVAAAPAPSAFPAGAAAVQFESGARRGRPAREGGCFPGLNSGSVSSEAAGGGRSEKERRTADCNDQ